MPVIDLPRFNQHPRRAAGPIRERTSNRTLLLLVLYIQGATLGIVIGGGLFTAAMLSDIASRPALVAPIPPQFREVGW